MFHSIEELIVQSKNYDSVAALMIATEIALTGRSREEILQLMERNLTVMEQSIIEGVAGVTSVTGLTGGDAARMNDYLLAGEFLSGEIILNAVRNAIAVSGAEGGCQAEIGSASAMAAAALVWAKGGSAEQSAQAVAITLKNMMGLICDPVAGLVEVPCVKRNALGSSQAFISADMALAGIKSVIPADEVIAAMYQVGRQMPAIFKETAEGGLAMTPTAQRLTKELMGTE